MDSQLDIGLALERISDGIIVYDRQWRFRYLNRAAERYLNRPRAELLGRSLVEVFPVMENAPVLARLKAAMSAGVPSEYEDFGPVMKRWLLFRIFPSEDGITLYFRDITERKQREQALAESEARHRAIFENAIEAMLLTVPTGEILAANPEACRLLGRTEEEIVKGGRAGVVDANDPRVEKFLEERARTGKARSVLTMIRKDGSRFEAELSSGVFKLADGSLRTSMSFHDLTAQLDAQAAIEFLASAGRALLGSLDYEKTIQKLMELAVPYLGDYAAFYVVEGRQIRRAGQGGRAPAGPTLREFQRGARWRRGNAVERVLLSGEPEFVPDVTEEWLRDATVDPAHFEAAKKLDVVSAMALPLKAGGQLLGVLALSRSRPGRRYVVRDFELARGLADRAAMAILSSKLYREAMEARKLRDDTLNAVSHDLRSPLNGVMLSASVLQRRLPDAPEIDAIFKLVRRSSRLLDDLLLAAMLESGSLPLDKRVESIGAIIDEAVSLHQALAESKAIHLEASVAENFPAIRLDRHRILQVLSNLIGNAIKFTPTGGQISLRAEPIGDAVELSVTDTGMGIAAEDVPHVFDRFWQSARSKKAGVGLGLAISKGIVEAHGGTIRCESHPGGGSTFTFTLPVETATDAAAEPVLQL